MSEPVDPPYEEHFPGTRLVDWMAVDGYNWGATRNWGWQTYADIFAATVRDLGLAVIERVIERPR